MLFHRLIESIKTQVVLSEIDFVQKSFLKNLIGRRVDFAFEDRLLDSLSVILANLRHSPQASAASGCFGGDIVSDQYQHRSPMEIGHVRRSVAAQETRQQARLQVRKKADRYLLFQDRMRQCFLLAFLIGGDDRFATLVV